MKRSFKLKAFVLAMVVMMGLTLVPSLYAASVFKNEDGVTESNAEFIVSYTIDKAIDSETGKAAVNPGDIVTVSVNLDKLPNNGFGIIAFSNRLVYDPEKIEPVVKGNDLFGNKIYQFTPGEAGTALRFEDTSAAVSDVPSDASLKQLSFNQAIDSSKPSLVTGKIADIQFRVKDDASGDIRLFLSSTSAEDNGFAIAGVRLNSSNLPETDATLSFYVKDSMSNKLCVEIPATDVVIDGIVSVDLDKTSKKSMDIYQYVKKVPSNTTDVPKFTSNHPEIATVDDNGIVTAVSNGNATITVTLGTHTTTLPVTVRTSPSTITVSQDKFTLDFGTTKNLKNEVTVGPEDVTAGYTMTWSSDNESVATVDENGVVTAKAKGKANITVTAGNVTKTIAVSVNVPIQSITVDPADVIVWKGETAKVAVKANPEGAEWDTLETEFISGAEYSEAKPVSDGVEIKGTARGTSVVAVSANKNNTGDDLYKFVNVTVKENKVTGVSIDTAAESNEILRGETLTLEGAYTTEVDEETVHKSTDDTTKKWESLNPEIATVDENGVVTAVKEGVATIKLTVAGKEATYDVLVTEHHVEGVVISEEDQKALEELEELTVGDELKIPFTLKPEGIITDTVEEILEFIDVDFDKDLVDVKVEYNKETGKGMITISVKAAGDVKVDILAEYIQNGEVLTYELTFKAVEPVVEEEVPETGDMPVVMLVALMAVSVMGIVASKKVFVK